MIDVRQLRHFIAVAEERHFCRAADRLNMTQPPLSLSIKKLEQNLDVTLFERTNRKVELTEAGTTFLDGAYGLLQQLETLQKETKRADQGLIGKLSLGFAGSAIYDALPRSVRKFRHLYPDVEIELKELSTLQQAEAIIKGELDAGLLRPPIQNSELFEIQVITDEKLVAVLPSSHPFADKSKLSLSDLADEDFITFAKETSPNLHNLILLACSEAGFTPEITQTAPQIQTHISLVSAELGVSLVPECTSKITHPNVTFRKISGPNKYVKTSMAVARKRDNTSPILNAFMEICKNDL